LDTVQFDENEQLFTNSSRTFVDVILPFPLPKLYSYSVPFHMLHEISIGLRVELLFGKKGLVTGIIGRIHKDEPSYETKPILSILDDYPLIGEKQLQFWSWMSEYYLCTLGEIMQAALPGALKLVGESVLLANDSLLSCNDLEQNWEGQELAFLMFLKEKKEIKIDDAKKKFQLPAFNKSLKKILETGFVSIREELKEKYKPKKVGFIEINPLFLPQNTEGFKTSLDLIGKKSIHQQQLWLCIIQFYQQGKELRRKEILEKAQVDLQVLKKLEEKSLIYLYEAEESRVNKSAGAKNNFQFTPNQEIASNSIDNLWNDKKVVLLEGVTGSGKTQIYIDLIRRIMKEGKQVLFLLPEIALTTHIVARLRGEFGANMVVYHSKFNPNERVDSWKEVMSDTQLIVGARSSIFLPFRDLGLIIVDEEHDSSYKQIDPAPRYHARDAAIYLASLYNSKVLLGTATPSLESYKNVLTNKYGYVQLKERFTGVEMPEIKLIDLLEEKKKGKLRSIFSESLLEAIQKTIDQKLQVILFQNRRGYAPMYQCQTCSWVSKCDDCDVSHTYHKFGNFLQCHYCAKQKNLDKICPDCHSNDLKIVGLGTEKIEDELQIYLPQVRVKRLDLDVAKGKDGYETIMDAFSKGEIDVLVGTQMISKGLDFEKVGLVAVIQADQLLRYPDFRSSEKAFQLLMQVSGRAGRKFHKGQVLIQTTKLDHPVLQYLVQYKQKEFYDQELEERKEFMYPPFYRLIQIDILHKEKAIVDASTQIFYEKLRREFGYRLLGPSTPVVSRIRTYYIKELLLKLELNQRFIKDTKLKVLNLWNEVKSDSKFATCRIKINVDPF